MCVSNIARGTIPILTLSCNFTLWHSQYMYFVQLENTSLVFSWLISSSCFVHGQDWDSEMIHVRGITVIGLFDKRTILVNHQVITSVL